MKRISIIVPCYNEEEAIPLFYKALHKEFAKLAAEPEVWFVNDGSTDGSLAQMKALRKKDEHVHYLSFSRNFGKEAALYAGLEAATGDYVAVMDADGQDPPTLLPAMLKTLESGDADCVATRRVTRKGEPKLRSFFARRFYSIINRISKTEVVGRRTRLPADDPPDGRRHPFPAGGQPLFQGHLRLGGIQHPVDRV